MADQSKCKISGSKVGIILASVIVLSAVGGSVGVSYYAGVKAEEASVAFVEGMKKHLTPGEVVKLDFERGIFSSKAKLNYTLSSGAKAVLGFNSDLTIKHMPQDVFKSVLPFDGSGSFAPNGQIAIKPAGALIQMTGAFTPDGMSYEAKSPALSLEVKDSGITVEQEASTYSVKVGAGAKDVSMVMQVPVIRVSVKPDEAPAAAGADKAPDEVAAAEPTSAPAQASPVGGKTIELAGINMKLSQSFPTENLPDQTMTLDVNKVVADNTKAEGLNVSWSGKVESGKYRMNTGVTIKQVSLAKETVAQNLKLKASMAGLDAGALNELVKLIQSYPEGKAPEQEKKAIELAGKLLTGGFELGIDEISGGLEKQKMMASFKYGIEPSKSKEEFLLSTKFFANAKIQAEGAWGDMLKIALPSNHSANEGPVSVTFDFKGGTLKINDESEATGQYNAALQKSLYDVDQQLAQFLPFMKPIDPAGTVSETPSTPEAGGDSKAASPAMEVVPVQPTATPAAAPTAAPTAAAAAAPTAAAAAAAETQTPAATPAAKK